jgi:hypothetical protein
MIVPQGTDGGPWWKQYATPPGQQGATLIDQIFTENVQKDFGNGLEFRNELLLVFGVVDPQGQPTLVCEEFNAILSTNGNLYKTLSGMVGAPWDARRDTDELTGLSFLVNVVHENKVSRKGTAYTIVKPQQIAPLPAAMAQTAVPLTWFQEWYASVKADGLAKEAARALSLGVQEAAEALTVPAGPPGNQGPVGSTGIPAPVAPAPVAPAPVAPAPYTAPPPTPGGVPVTGGPGDELPYTFTAPAAVGDVPF